MSATRTLYRPARPEDAEAIAELLVIGGQGIVEYLWSLESPEGQTPLAVGIERAGRDEDALSYRNAILAERDGYPVGLLLGHLRPQSGPADIAAIDGLPPVLHPFRVLEHRAAGTFFINGLAVRPEHRGNGIGSKLLYKSRQRAIEVGTARISVELFAQDEDALRLYQRHGFRILDRRPVVPHPCHRFSGDLLLLEQKLN
ncbi:MAG TPA: GNAT family N-acetyltransferase [Alphaproteobacteria bacterium]|nr:GNAT family N-acetyltransferase [Alphaproteobacteria bacterium]